MRTNSCGSFVALFLGCVLACATTAEAQYRDGARNRDAPSRLRLHGGVGIGFGGELEIDGGGPLGLSVTDDLTTSIGGQAGVDAVVRKYLALGGELRVVGFNTEGADRAGVDRSKLIDVNFKPRLRMPLVNDRFEIYGALPIGLTIPLLSDDIAGDAGVDGTVGWNLGVGGGMTFFVTPRFGVNLEPMWVMRWFGVETQGGADADVTMKQFTLFANAVIAL